MKCPACSQALSPITHGNITVDACAGGCGGVWFDAREIYEVDEPKEVLGQKLLEIPRAAQIVKKSAQKQCPKCAHEPLVRQFFDTKAQVEIDLCWSCGGVWLDTGELSTIRNQFSSAQERQKAGDAFVADAVQQHMNAVALANKQDREKCNQAHSTRLQSLFSSLRTLIDPLGDGILK